MFKSLVLDQLQQGRASNLEWIEWHAAQVFVIFTCIKTECACLP